ncbi:PP2C family protein-serine/threonine phosphatase [Candidatus Neomarinimicrobiota bacterium]
MLAVDDKLENLKILIAYLENSGFEIMVAQGGEEAFQHIERVIPDMILLDILMPGIDGFEVCSRLKTNDVTKDIPVIFMTALTDTADKVKGFELGAVDYLTKPLQHEEVLARVNAHMTIRELQQQLQEQNALLQHKNILLKKYTDKINADIERAHEIQQLFLPTSDNMPYPDKIDWAYSFEPADEVSGDYYDVSVIDENRLAILFSDVCGHGIPAAFITAILKTTFQAWLEYSDSLSELGNNLNRKLYQLTPRDSFAAVFVAIYDLTTGVCQYINFGHKPAPWLIPSGKNKPIQALNSARSLLLGFQEQIDLPIAEFTLSPGDSMIIVSDGILENHKHDEIDYDRNYDELEYDMVYFENFLKKSKSLPVYKLVEKIKEEADCFTGTTEQLDDRTILAFKIKK